MLNNKDNILQSLAKLNLSRDEATIYVELLRKPLNHLELSRRTGINRTKVYRLGDQLEKRSLVTTISDDRGTFLVAGDPTTLEVELIDHEEKIQEQRIIFDDLLPRLKSIGVTANPDDFTIATYEGTAGMKQMLWHELKANTELLVFGNGQLEDLVGSRSWSEKYRELSTEAKITMRELLNPGNKPDVFTKNTTYMENYERRLLEQTLLELDQQTSIYNDTVATYNWHGDRRVGVEITNAAHAHMMRQIFNHYWSLSK